ncbi:unnamed protein product [Trichogramma brassicae]|uniref:Uncharacterized protein n=1 Tax=Trichogramma brassicae TaxID=86971 RepID=A0A6H5I261_9HYME|nr:unnamed protein product [Trichogramma brassicae]
MELGVAGYTFSFDDPRSTIRFLVRLWVRCLNRAAIVRPSALQRHALRLQLPGQVPTPLPRGLQRPLLNDSTKDEAEPVEWRLYRCADTSPDRLQFVQPVFPQRPIVLLGPESVPWTCAKREFSTTSLQRGIIQAIVQSCASLIPPPPPHVPNQEEMAREQGLSPTQCSAPGPDTPPACNNK